MTTIYSGGIGINNKVVPHRLPFDQKTGVAAFESATDVLIDKTGEVVSLRGTSKVQDGSFHSFFRASNGFYVVKNRDSDSALYKAIPDATGELTLSGIRSGLTNNAKISFVELNGEYLYCNGYQNGILSQDVSSPWPVNVWKGPETSKPMLPTPVGSHIDLLSGRILVSVDNELIFTEYGRPGLIDGVDNNRLFESKILMICAVETGVYVSDEKAIFFLQGNNPHKWKMRKVLDYPAIEWGVNQDLVNPSKFGFDAHGLSGLFATVKGPVIGLQDGTAINLIDDNVKLPDNCGNQVGSIMITDETLIIQSGV